MSRDRWLLLIPLLCCAGIAHAADAQAIEGKWRGVAGTPLDRIDVGFEIKRDEAGALNVYLYEPVINFYGLKLGAFAVDGDTFSLPDETLTVALKDGRLEGTYLTPDTPVSLERATTLPSEVPVPDLPRGAGPLWQAKLGGAIYAPAAVHAGTAYVGTTGGLFYAVDVSDGSFRWIYVAGRPIHGEAVVTDEHLYFVCDNGYLLKLDRETGKEIWRYDLGDARVARALGHQVLDDRGIGEFDFDHGAPRPLLADGVLYVGSGDGSLHAVDAAAGTRTWRFEGQGKVRTNAVLDGARVVFGTFDGLVYAVDRASGREVWRKETHASISGSPAIIGGTLVVGNRSGLLAGLDPATGKVLWRRVFWGSAVESSPVPDQGSLFYIGSSDLRRVSHIDAKDGRVLWRTDVYGLPWATPAVGDGALYVSACGSDPYEIRHLGSFSALDRETGHILWRWPVAANTALYAGFIAAPVVAGKRVIVGGLDGDLYAFPAEI